MFDFNDPGNTGSLKSDRKRGMMKKDKRWQNEIPVSAIGHCESNGSFTAITSTTKQALYDVAKNNHPLNNQNKGYIPS